MRRKKPLAQAKNSLNGSAKLKMKYPEATILIVEENWDDALLIQRALRRAKLINPLQVVENGVPSLRTSAPS